MSRFDRKLPVASLAANFCNAAILLKNLPATTLGAVSGVLRRSTEGRSSILGQSERSSFQGSVARDRRSELFSGIQR
jgi:hypothetical protein